MTQDDIPMVDEAKPLPVPQDVGERVRYALVVTLLPIICFSLSELLKPDWQSGQLSDYAKLMLLWDVAWYFFPCLLYSVACLLLLLVAPRRFAGRFVIRFGVYTGLLLALHFTLLLVFSDFAILGGLAASFLILASWVYGKVIPGLRVAYFFLLLAIVLVIGLLFWHVSLSSVSSITAFLGNAPIGALIAVLAAAPFLCLVVTAIISMKLFKNYEANVPVLSWRLAGLTGWLIAYGFAWRFSVLQAIQVYHALPTSPQDCYVATASARGHRRVVASWSVVTPGGSMPVTRQLQVLKCAELALLACAPRLHRLLRGGYDRCGPPLARRLGNPYLADLAYLSLKPLEWSAILALKVIIPDAGEYIGRLYSAQK